MPLKTATNELNGLDSHQKMEEMERYLNKRAETEQKTS